MPSQVPGWDIAERVRVADDRGWQELVIFPARGARVEHALRGEGIALAGEHALDRAGAGFGQSDMQDELAGHGVGLVLAGWGRVGRQHGWLNPAAPVRLVLPPPQTSTASFAYSFGDRQIVAERLGRSQRANTLRGSNGAIFCRRRCFGTGLTRAAGLVA